MATRTRASPPTGPTGGLQAPDQIGTQRQQAEDIVQDACLAVLEGQVELSPDPRAALLDVLKAVAGAAKEEVLRASHRRKRA
jgi:hypothetical protein